jgi:Pregnancy-associated plasma protein-A
MGRLTVSWCALAVTLCALPVTGSARRSTPAAPVVADPCARTTGTARPRDHHPLDPEQVKEMLADLRRALRARYGTADEDAFDASRASPPRITVPVRFHAITDGTSGKVTEAVAERQIVTLNDVYGGRFGGVDTGVSFRLRAYHLTVNAAWFRWPQRHETAMKTALRREGPGVLNLYSAAVGADVLGFSTFPQRYADRPRIDGVVVDHRSLPGGPYRHFSLGFTAAHEIGHWLGLFHTFENGCEEPGDGIDDTPFEALPVDGCPASRDTCRQLGADPVHNFMNYGWDDCMREFTAGQARRVRTAWAAFRAPPPTREQAMRVGSVGGAR